MQLGNLFSTTIRHSENDEPDGHAKHGVQGIALQCKEHDHECEERQYDPRHQQPTWHFEVGRYMQLWIDLPVKGVGHHYHYPSEDEQDS